MPSITAGMLAAERKCCIFYQLPWDKETHKVILSKNIVKSLFMGMPQIIDMHNILDLKMKKLKEPFDLSTTYQDCNALLKTLCYYRHDLIKFRHVNQDMNYTACEQVFVAMHTKKNCEVLRRPRKILKQNEETTWMMQSLPKSKKKGSGNITNILVPLPTAKEELEWGSVTDGPDIEWLIID